MNRKVEINAQALDDFIISVGFLVDNIQCNLEDYELDGELTEKAVKNIHKRLETVEKFQKKIYEELGFK